MHFKPFDLQRLSDSVEEILASLSHKFAETSAALALSDGNARGAASRGADGKKDTGVTKRKFSGREMDPYLARTRAGLAAATESAHTRGQASVPRIVRAAKWDGDLLRCVKRRRTADASRFRCRQA
ncbi:hypothetical protein MRX96_037255 [Rhipicephalus microplus]